VLLVRAAERGGKSSMLVGSTLFSWERVFIVRSLDDVNGLN
jgi:hypothetical protein